MITGRSPLPKWRHRPPRSIGRERHTPISLTLRASGRSQKGDQLPRRVRGIVGAVLFAALFVLTAVAPSTAFAAINETVGGVTHTWTDYADAGGTEGPSIAGSQTVQVTCRVTGFAVADGNTWWYQIASSPWNNVYYASSDAFYNNGETSGSLVGTPWFDPAVPVCSSTTGTTTPGAPTTGTGSGGTGSSGGGGLPDGEFSVMNASGGIYWRSGPDWNTAETTAGSGFYPGTVVAVYCYQTGAADVPGSTESMWEQATWVSGPGGGHGWINEHFLNDGVAPDQHSPGVVACSSGAAAGSGTTVGTTAPIRTAPAPTPSEQVLAMDPNIWCYNTELPSLFATQITESGWVVLYKGLRGTAGKNDWKCSYLVSMVGPGDQDGGFTVPLPITENYPINFEAVCHSQFAGATLRWAPASGQWPWQCVGAAGKYYPPPGLNTNVVADRAGFATTGLPASGAGTLALKMTYGSATGRTAVAASQMILGSASRAVRHAGRYALRLHLTHTGRRLFRGRAKLRVRFDFVFVARNGHSVRLSGTKTL